MAAESEFEQLRELAQRLLGHPHPEGRASVELFVGRLPERVAAELPMPEGVRLVGSALDSVDGRPIMLTAVFDSAAGVDAAVGAYEGRVREQGWNPFERHPGVLGGFMPSGMPGFGRSYTRGDAGPLLTVSAGDSELTLRLSWDMARRMPPARPPEMHAGTRMPALFPPAGVCLQPRGGGGGEDSWHTDAVVRSDRPVGELEAHFAGQLAAASWTRLDGRSEKDVAWSAWRLPGEGDWRGLLLVLGLFESDRRSLTLRIESRDTGGGGWSSSFGAMGRM